MSKQSDLDEILPSLWSLLDDHFDTELLSDKCVDEINDLILNWHNKQIEEAFKRGYISGGIDELNKEDV